MLIVFSAAILLPTVVVVVAICAMLWRARTSKHDGVVALVSSMALVVWGVASTVLAYRGFFQPRSARSFPPIGTNLIAVLLLLALCLILSTSLRRLLSNQTYLTRLNVWRLLGAVFLILMALGQMPALWAIPAGIGDVLVGAAAFSVARHLESPRGRRRAIIFNLLGMTDLIVAVFLGVTTNPGPAQIFHTTPTSVLITKFPLALVPTFLVPLAFTIHVVSLWQLFGFKWAPSSVERRRSSRLDGSGRSKVLGLATE